MWNVLFATDGSPCAEDAAGFLREMGLPPGSRICVCTVLDRGVERLLELAGVRRLEPPNRLVARVAGEFACRGIAATHSVLLGHGARAIVQCARETRADLVVTGSRGLTGIGGLLLGSVAQYVADRAPCCVLVARPAHCKIRSILLAADTSDGADRAADWLVRCPLPPDTRITVATVLRPPDPAPELPYCQAPLYCADSEQERRAAEEVLENVCESLTALGRSCCPVVRMGSPAAELLRLAEECHADLIALGARTSSLFERWVLGCVADGVLRYARCSVLVAR